jgi:TPP-dependent pyruvate/acetoin dehydrogenase alpha subunit
MRNTEELIEEISRLRHVQLAVNSEIVANKFKIPVHLALGHEALAVSVVEAMSGDDTILLTHRNIHYHLALGANQDELMSEYNLDSMGLAGGKFGSMNLNAVSKRNIYTSNILGNNLAVALGVSKSNQLQHFENVTWVVTGDGAIEEGVFYESLLSASSWKLPIVYVIENNQWSLGTKIDDRRTQIDLESFCNSLGVEYFELRGNGVVEYVRILREARQTARQGKPVVIEAHLESLGGYYVEEELGTRYINYHAGKAKIEMAGNVLEESNSDPVYVNEEIRKGAREK